jgi:NADH dehydrogenase
MQDLITVFGGSGFIGTQVVRALARQGLRVRVAVRQPHVAYNMRLMGDVGQVDVVQANVRHEGSVRRALEGAAGVVNLVGVGYETGRQRFGSVNVEGAEAVARIARDLGVARLVHMSALGADATSDSRYARTKGEAEAAVRAAFPEAVIVRPSIVFGPGDSFFNRFGEMAAMSPALPLIGAETKFQPVYVGDVARAIARAMIDPGLAGGVFELVGPETLTMREILTLVLRETERRRFLLPLPAFVASLIGRLCEPLGFFTPVAPPITSDQVKLLQIDNVASGAAPGLVELGVIQPARLEAILPSYLFRFRPGGQYADLKEKVAL